MSVVEKSQNSASTVEVESWLQSKADRLERQKRHPEAATILKKLLERLKMAGASDHSVAEVHFRLGKIHFRLQHRIKAVFHLRAAIRLDHTRSSYYELFGRCFLLSGHWRIAKHQLEKAIRLNQHSPDLWALYAWATLKSGDKKRALQAGKRALKYDAGEKTRDTVNLQLMQVFTETAAWDDLATHIRKWRAQCSPSTSRVLREALQISRRKYRLSFQGAVHQLIRRRIQLNGRPFQLSHVREAEKIWLGFCRREAVFAAKRAHLRLTKVWAAASAYVALKRGTAHPSHTEDLKQFLHSASQNFRVVEHEIEAASKILESDVA